MGYTGAGDRLRPRPAPVLRFQAMKAAPAFGGHTASYHPEIFILETGFMAGESSHESTGLFLPLWSLEKRHHSYRRFDLRAVLALRIYP